MRRFLTSRGFILFALAFLCGFFWSRISEAIWPQPPVLGVTKEERDCILQALEGESGACFVVEEPIILGAPDCPYAVYVERRSDGLRSLPHCRRGSPP